MNHERLRWRYRVLRVEPPVATEDLDAQGTDGWELVAAVPEPASASVSLVFKRPAPGFRERITLDQRASVTGEHEDGTP
jgi:hypothetical protein